MIERWMTERGLKTSDKGDHGFLGLQSMWMGTSPQQYSAGLLELRKSVDGLT